MTDLLPPARLQHVAANRKTGDAALRVLSADDFATARAEPVRFHNPLQDRPFTQTVYLATAPH